MIDVLVRKKKEYLFIFCIYSAITIIIFWQRFSHFFTHYGMPDIDSDGTMWYLWARIFAQQHSIYFNLNNSLFGFPVGYDFSFIPLFSLIYEMGIGLIKLGGGMWTAVVAFANFSTLIAYPLSALAGFGLSYYVTRNKYASFLAGISFGFSYYHILMGRGFMSTNHLEFIPLYFLSLLYALNKRTMSSFIISAMALSVGFMCNAYWAFFCGLFSIVFFLFDCVQEKSGRTKIIIKYYFVLLIVLLLTNINYFVSQRRVFSQQNFTTIGRNFVATDQTVSILSFFAPSPDNWLYPFSGNGNNFLGYVALTLGLAGVYLLKKNQLFSVFCVCFLVSLLLASNLPGLFFVNQVYFAVFGMFRAVSRLNIFSSLFLSLMVAMTVSELMRKYLWSQKKIE